MDLKQLSPRALYKRLYQYVAHTRLIKNDVDPKQIHAQLATVLATGIIIWSYTIVAYFSFATPIPFYVGLVCSVFHILSPFLFRFTNNVNSITHLVLGSALIDQMVYSYFSGGFMSFAVLWMGILPVMGGLVCGRKVSVIWFFITSCAGIIFLFLHLTGHHFPLMMTHNGFIWAHALLIFGWICVNTAVVLLFMGTREAREKLLNEQGHKIDDLFRVLFHDLANPLGRISIGLTIAKRQFKEGESNRGIEIAVAATDSMLEITKNVRKMYAISKGKANVDLAYTPLNSAVEYIKGVYANELEKKKLELDYHFEKNAGLSLLVEPISFNNQVLGNIISNSIKFSHEGGKILVNVYPLNQEIYTVEIKDHGIGIPPELLGQLFDINKKSSRPGTQGEAGTGFGMHIVKSFVEMYGGQMGIESFERKDEIPGGTTIRILLKGAWS